MRMCLSLLSAGLVCAQVTLAVGQTNPSTRKPVEGSSKQIITEQRPTTLDLDPNLDAEANEGGAGSFDSRPVGARQKWQLDNGYFETDERITGTKRPDHATEDYSGIRLRRPRIP